MQSLDLHKAGRLHFSEQARQCSCCKKQVTLCELLGQIHIHTLRSPSCSQWAWMPRSTDAGQRRQRQQGPGARRAARRGHGVGSGGQGMLRRPGAPRGAVRR